MPRTHRRDRRLEILGPGIDQEVARHESVGKALAEERLQCRDGVEKLIGLPRVLGTPGAVRVGIALVVIGDVGESRRAVGRQRRTWLVLTVLKQKGHANNVPLEAVAVVFGRDSSALGGLAGLVAL